MMTLNARGVLGLAVIVVLGLGGYQAQAALIYEYDAALDPDGGTDNQWESNINNSNIHGSNVVRDWTLTNYTYNASAGSAYSGVQSSYTFSGGGGSGGTTGQFGRDNLPLGGTKNNATGASATFEMWVKPSQTSLGDIGNETLWESGGNTSGAQLIFRDAGTGVDLRFRTRYGNQSVTNTTVVASLTDDALLDDYMQVVGVVDPAGGTEQMRLYVNGQKVGSSTAYNHWQDGTDGSGLAKTNNALGGQQTGDGGLFDGDVAILRLYDDPLSDAEVLASWNAVTAAVGPPPPPALPDPIAFWDFEDVKANVDSGAAGAVADKSGYGRHGTAIAGATLATDVPAALSGVGLSTTSLRLDGTGDQVNISGYKGVTGTNARTMSAWVKLEEDTPQQNRSIMSWGQDAGGKKWNFRVQNSNGTDGAIRVEVNGGFIVGSTDLSDGMWHHVAATWEDDGTPNVTDILLYVDGALESVSAQQGKVIDTASSKDVQLGRDHENRRMMGWLDNAQIYDVALSAEQIAALANPTSAVIPEPVTILAVSFGIAGLGRYVRKRRRRT